MLKKLLNWFLEDDQITKALKCRNIELGFPEDFGIISNSDMFYIVISGRLPEDK